MLETITLEIDSFDSDFERKIEQSMARLERRDERQRRKQAIQCELHLQDLRKHHRPLESISKEGAAAVRRKSGVQQQEAPSKRFELARQAAGWMVECLPK
jgi:hypothetical protein